MAGGFSVQTQLYIINCAHNNFSLLRKLSSSTLRLVAQSQPLNESIMIMWKEIGLGPIFNEEAITLARTWAPASASDWRPYDNAMIFSSSLVGGLNEP